jgi:lysozyme family protein
MRQRLRSREGGFSDEPLDQGGPTLKGISTEFLKLYNAKHPETGLPDDPAQLTERQITNLFYDEFFAKPRIADLAAVPGLAAASPQLAEQIFDIGVLHRPTRAGVWLQQTLDQFLGTDLRKTEKNGKIFYDGIVGPRTRAAVELAVRRGSIGAVNDQIVRRRVWFMWGLSARENFERGWLSRAFSFLSTPPPIP